MGLWRAEIPVTQSSPSSAGQERGGVIQQVSVSSVSMVERHLWKVTDLGPDL